MEQFQINVRKLIELIGFQEPGVDFDIEGRRVNIFLNEEEWFKTWLPSIVGELDHLVKLLAKKEGVESFYVDINNYRKERERIIADLAKAAAKKVSATKAEVKLPSMNAYERRIIHTELSMHPDVKTESLGEGKGRYVVIKPVV